MEPHAPQLLLVLTAVIFASAFFLHLVKKNSSAIWLYALQSAAVGIMLLSSEEQAPLLLLVAILATLLVKVIIAPTFLFSVMRRYPLKFSSTTYLSVPLTLIVIALLVAFTQTQFLRPIIALAPGSETAILVTLASILISLFLTINRKGALSQMIGILSLENSIVAFALFAGLEQNPGLQLGITFDIFIWTMVATMFLSMIYRQFGTLDVTTMRRLTE